MVSVPCRFGETGVVKEIDNGRYGVEFEGLPCLLWYDAGELLAYSGPPWHWYRPKNLWRQERVEVNSPKSTPANVPEIDLKELSEHFKKIRIKWRHGDRKTQIEA